MQDEESVVETRGREDGQKWVEHRNTYLLHPCESTTTYMLSDNMTLLGITKCVIKIKRSRKEMVFLYMKVHFVDHRNCHRRLFYFPVSHPIGTVRAPRAYLAGQSRGQKRTLT